MYAIQTTRSYWLTILLSLTVLHLVHSQITVTETTIDDVHPAIKYSGGWTAISLDSETIPGDSEPIPVDSHQTYNGTVMLARAAGSTATYKFNGTRVSVFGAQGPTDPKNATISTYSIDNSSPSEYTIPSDLKTTQYRVAFYSSPLLKEGEHTLVITNLNDRAWYWLDYIQVTSPDKSSDPTPTPTPTAGSTQQSKAGISKGAIAGIALGVSALMVLLLLAALLWKQRHLKSTEGDSTADLQPLEGGMMRDSALLEPYQVEHFVSDIPTSSNGLNEKRTHDGVAPILSTENNVNLSHSLVNGHASDNAITQERREDTSDPMSRPMSLSKLRPPYRGAPSSRSTGNPSSAPMPQMPPGVPTLSSPPQISSSNRRSTDGGVRIAGGPPPRTGEEELGETIDTSSLPPAYGTY